MKNVYIIIQNGTGNVNLTSALTRGIKNSIHPHENIHYSTSNGKSILNGNFTPEELAWFETQSWAYIMGDYIQGRAEAKVYTQGWNFTKPANATYE